MHFKVNTKDNHQSLFYSIIKLNRNIRNYKSCKRIYKGNLFDFCFLFMLYDILNKIKWKND